MRLSEIAHLLRYPHPSSLRRTFMYASFLGISEALHLDIFRQPQRREFFDRFIGSLFVGCKILPYKRHECCRVAFHMPLL